MKYVALVDGQEVPVEIIKRDALYDVTVGEKSFTVNAGWPNHRGLSLLIEGKSYEVSLERAGNRVSVYFYDDTISFEFFEARKYKARELTKRSVPGGPLKVLAPMPGKIVKIRVTENAQVCEGDSLLIMEAMKMQNELKAPRDGTIRQVHVREGEPVSPSQLLMVLE